MWNEFYFDPRGKYSEQPQDDSLKSHPMFLKSLEILTLTRTLVGTLDEARAELYGAAMLGNASKINVRFAHAEKSDIYNQKMENALLVKLHAKNLYAISFRLALERTHAEEHLDLLRNAILDYRELFKAWIKTFGSARKKSDGWGMFED
ncbi:phosphoribosylaminoimidazole carboxylase catalytic subunit [Indibacter alkaliphilus LW1]|jgi:hypothetical protein|uniref:Phosphoribosylaminoimidazole carboxylase catalytic subunit n=1 Tax=Indibacter alkaliphilus (strain CCUG 57479 / KCTC 22604 / LW1) TaxID=1189612 RepID=S2CXZ7_INDAL|nr:hypothetical protein [Indibacter alkaliphilus]EOZ92037.1 phosphoribosylaminoimidazole carboxylase catalytic subunit [Indibacter alkaliphilus LW1]